MEKQKRRSHTLARSEAYSTSIRTLMSSTVITFRNESSTAREAQMVSPPSQSPDQGGASCRLSRWRVKAHCRYRSLDPMRAE